MTASSHCCALTSLCALSGLATSHWHHCPGLPCPVAAASSWYPQKSMIDCLGLLMVPVNGSDCTLEKVW